MNPFPITKYISPLYFCDRERETEMIISALKSDRNITLYSIRRLGKTGLIHHVFDQLKHENIITSYVDILDTTSESEFINSLVNSTLESLQKDDDNLIKKVLKAFSQFRPKLTVDPYTGATSVQLDIENQDEVDLSLKTLFSIIKKRKKQTIIAIDEFQQIEKYNNNRIAATLRKYLTSVKELNFIFSGSQQNLLLHMFTSPKAALFQSTQLIPLEKIEQSSYIPFIKHHFNQGLKKISNDQIQHIIEWTCTHTFYVQFFCNRLFDRSGKKVNDKDLETIKQEILKENEVVYYNYKNILAHNQWSLLKAIALEETVIQINAKKFIAKHHLSTAGTIRKSAKYLLEKELIYITQDPTTEKPKYHIYDPFLLRWIQSKHQKHT